VKVFIHNLRDSIDETKDALLLEKFQQNKQSLDFVDSVLRSAAIDSGIYSGQKIQKFQLPDLFYTLDIK
jgi:hypothetical protein